VIVIILIFINCGVYSYGMDFSSVFVVCIAIKPQVFMIPWVSHDTT
jgi:hypothetical protein